MKYSNSGLGAFLDISGFSTTNYPILARRGRNSKLKQIYFLFLTALPTKFASRLQLFDVCKICFRRWVKI